MVKTDPVENSNPCVTCFQNYLLPQRFFTLSIYLICKKVKKKKNLVSLICYVILVQCITVCLSYKQYKKGCCCSYSESLGQSALRQRSTAREQPTALLPDLSERPEEPTLSEREHWSWYYRLLVYAFASTQ